MSDMTSMIRILQQMQQLPTQRGPDYSGFAANAAGSGGGQSLYDLLTKKTGEKDASPMTTGAIPGINTPQGGFNGGDVVAPQLAAPPGAGAGKGGSGGLSGILSKIAMLG